MPVRARTANARYDMILLDAFEADYIPEHMLTKEFFEEVRSIMAPDAVLVANTFSSSTLYNNESVTYRAVFGQFFNLKLGNRVIVTKLGGLPPVTEIRANADKWEPKFHELDTTEDFIYPLMTTSMDWDPAARILTDQYSPSNVLNSMGRPSNDRSGQGEKE